MRYIFVVLLFSCLQLSFQKSRPEDDHYVAAVVEYRTNHSAQQNLVNYVNLIKEAAEKGADIVVFPEQTLTDSMSWFQVPINGALKQHPIPADRPDLYDRFLAGISKAALENDIYVVVNGRERLDCTAQDTTAIGEYCPESKEYLFITNVVFSRTGAIIDRYRKINLFLDKASPALRPELAEFTTDFGVSFGHFVCFDILFQVPAVQLVQKRHVKNVLFPTMWMSELPFLTAVQMQESYAYTNDVNVLAAGANNPMVGTAGSGIYSGKAGALISIMPGLSTTKVLVAKVPKVPGLLTETYPGPILRNPAELGNLHLAQDLSLRYHNSRLLEPGYQQFTLVHGDTTCKFKVTLTQRDGSKHYRYRAAVFSGFRSCYIRLKRGVRVCGIYACTGDDVTTFAVRFTPYEKNATAIFEELSITATMPTPILDEKLSTNNSIVYPVSTTVNILPLEPKEFYHTVFVKNNKETEHTIKLKNNNAELYSFGLFARNFDIDEKDEPNRSTRAFGTMCLGAMGHRQFTDNFLRLGARNTDIDLIGRRVATEKTTLGKISYQKSISLILTS